MKSYDKVACSERKRGGTIFELVGSFIVIFALIAIFSMYASRVTLTTKEAALQDELSNLRHSLEVYKVRNGALPADLRDLYATKDYFVQIKRVDSQAKPCDPFGHEYLYDPKSGKVSSGTSKYREW